MDLHTPESRELQRAIEFRKKLHETAELSGLEKKTVEVVKTFMSAYHAASFIDQLGGYGLLYRFDYSTEGPTILLRCELDGLPIGEDHLPLQYKSKNPGISHKCGHDGHMAILAGLAHYLQKLPFIRGSVVLLFQPAEETGSGAKAVLNDLRFQGTDPDYVFALHNLPGIPMGTIVCKPGTFTAAVCSMILEINGVGSHASEPEKGINPSLAISEIALLADQLAINQPQTPNFQLITPVYYRMGQRAYGMSAGEGEMHFTLRAWTSEALDRLIQTFTAKIRQIETQRQVEITISFIEHFASTSNDPGAVAIIEKAAVRSGMEYKRITEPFKFGEDFGLFTQKFKGAFFGIGAGIHHAPLHHQDYDFPDVIIENGITIFKNIVEMILNNDREDPSDTSPSI